MNQTRIGRLFDDYRRGGRKALIAYITAGDPSPARTPALVEALVRGGADLIELGVPFSDPVADGPVIQRAGERALAAGTTLRGVLEMACQVRRSSEVPILLFTYLNPVLRYGVEALARDAAASGIDGCLLTDASVEEAGAYVGEMHRHGLDTVFLAAPTSTPRRLKLVAEYSSGFVYLVSRTGVTGQRASLSAAVGPLVRAMREVTDLPLAVGFGVSRPEHVAELGRQVEGVVVGSAFVDAVARQGDAPGLEDRLEALARELKRGFEAGAVNRETALQALARHRERIDELDLRLLDLLNERTRVVADIGRIKRAAQLPIYEPRREDEVFRNVMEHNGGPLAPEALKRIFERIVDEMRKVQRELMESEPEQK